MSDPEIWTQEQRAAVAKLRTAVEAVVRTPSTTTRADLALASAAVDELGLESWRVTPDGYDEDRAQLSDIRIATTSIGASVAIRRLIPVNGIELIVGAVFIGTCMVGDRHATVSLYNGSLLIELDREPGDETDLGRDRFMVLLEDVVATLTCVLQGL